MGDPPEVYGERIRPVQGAQYREWVPGRSKLGAALALGYRGRLPRDGERWLYLGGASGTTVSHIADLLGPSGGVFVVERSLRPFARLLRVAERYPNILPFLADAREPGEYLGFVPPVDGVYVDIAQADQVEIALANCRWMLDPKGTLLVALKTASMGRGASAEEHLRRTQMALRPLFRLDPPLKLDPFHKRHYLLSGAARPDLYREESGSPARPQSGRATGPPAGR